MKLQGKEGIAFELMVEGYQFPTIDNDPWDSNWLMMRGRVEHPRGGWSFRDPCLTAWEVEEVAGWLESLSASKVSEELELNEPSLRFLFAVEPAFAVEVCFAHECAPPWLEDGMEEAALLFPLSLNDLQAVARSLRQDLVRFPRRGVSVDFEA